MANLLLKERHRGGSLRKYFYESEGGGIFVKRRSSGTCLTAIVQRLKNVFLPQGYPKSVSEDYLIYQMWDSVQAFCCSILSALASYRIINGVLADPYLENQFGFFPCSFFRSRYRTHRSSHMAAQLAFIPENATVLAITTMWLAKDAIGMLGRVVFTWRRGKFLDSNCKAWRLCSEILNDAAICMEMFAPSFPSLFFPIICVAGMCKSVVCVASGATRAAITHHQARGNNLADVAARDVSQETLVKLTALLFYLTLIQFMAGNQILIFLTFISFTALHLYANYRAVASITMSSLNKARLQSIIQEYLRTGKVPNSETVSCQESVLGRTNCLLACHLGCSVERAVQTPHVFDRLERIYADAQYLLHVDHESHTAYAIFRMSATRECYLQAAVQFEVLDFVLSGGEGILQGPSGTCSHMRNLLRSSRRKDVFSLLRHSYQWVKTHFTGLQEELKAAGWNVDEVLFYVDEWRIM